MDSSDRGFSDYLNTAAPSSSQQHTTGAGKKPPSAGEAMQDAKVLLDAALSKLHKAENEAENGNHFEKAKVASAAGGLLAAAQHYGKLDEKKYGKYVEKAQDYLNKYGNSSPNNSSPPLSSHSSSPLPSSYSSSPPPSSHSASHTTSSHSSAPSEGIDYEKYLKKAEQFLRKH